MKQLICLLLLAFFFSFSLVAQRLSPGRLSLQHPPSTSIRTQKPFRQALSLSMGYNLTAGLGLLALPTHITHWKREDFITTAGPRLRTAWSQPPVWDHDNFWINYVGHPYQGAFYYNSLRSQGAPIWKCALFVTGQTLFWEFVFEAVKEHPSRQDLITTPLGGVLLGELGHQLTMRMRRGGFNLWEKAFVTLFNPAYLLQHGYK